LDVKFLLKYGLSNVSAGAAKLRSTKFNPLSAIALTIASVILATSFVAER